MKFTGQSGQDIKRLRSRLDISQGTFWSRVLVTQSGGSRYESGREIPESVVLVLNIAYGDDREAVRTIARLNPTLGKRLSNGKAKEVTHAITD